MPGAATEARDLRSPAKTARHGDGRVGSGLERRGDAFEVGRPVADRAKLFGMDAADNQQAVETGVGRTSDVGAQTVADGKNACAVRDAEQLEACVVDRTERLPMPADPASSLLVPLRQGTSAERRTVAVHDDEIGVGAHHRQTAGQRRSRFAVIAATAHSAGISANVSIAVSMRPELVQRRKVGETSTVSGSASVAKARDQRPHAVFAGSKVSSMSVIAARVPSTASTPLSHVRKWVYGSRCSTSNRA